MPGARASVQTNSSRALRQAQPQQDTRRTGVVATNIKSKMTLTCDSNDRSAMPTQISITRIRVTWQSETLFSADQVSEVQ